MPLPAIAIFRFDNATLMPYAMTNIVDAAQAQRRRCCAARKTIRESIQRQQSVSRARYAMRVRDVMRRYARYAAYAAYDGA